MFESEATLISTIARLKSAGQYKRYIDFIQFPYYRNLELNIRISFDFPFTVFIGQNGCGKSSALHALYGAVKGKTPGNFWFDTKVDPIQYYNDERKRHSFWYSFINDRGLVEEVLKARIKRSDNPNYWETSRPLTWAGMVKGKRSTPIAKNVIYLDFRAELSAFDKFFYFGDLKNVKSKNKQEFLRKKSISLNRIFSKKVSFIKSSTRSLNKALETLSADELKYISYILGREYTCCESVEHSIFRNEGYSVLFQTNFARYSEAFAGSGEMAVVRLVREVLAASDYSLILLDEPEVSLHPGAQGRLRNFLFDQIKRKKHQVVLTSHSPILIKSLPKEAIKVFNQNPSNGRFLITENLVPEEAFFHIEFPFDNRKNIIVEDKLSKEIIAAVLRQMGPATESVFNVRFYPGGESILKKDFIPVYCRDANSKDYIFFDGDQKRIPAHFDWRSLPTTDLTVSNLRKLIKATTGENIKFSVDSNQTMLDNIQEIELSKFYLDYYQSNVFYFPGIIPEEIIWDTNKARQLLNITISDSDEIVKIIEEIDAMVDVKKKFAVISKNIMGSDSGENIHSVHKLFILAWIEKNNNDLVYIKGMIAKIL